MDDFWSRVFGSGSSSDAAERTVVVEHGELLGEYEGIYCVLRRQRVLVSAPPPLVQPVIGWRPSVETVMDPQWWRERLADWSVLGPSVHSFLDRSGPAAATLGDAAVLPAGSDLLQLLRDRVTDSEWAESGFAGSDVANAWVVVDENDRPMAASNLTPFDGVPADVGVLADPAVRGRGVATTVAAAAARYAVEWHGIARWRAIETNAPSRRLANKLGFEADCVQLAVRPG